ncbi:hypothetical protein [Maribacter antarcticus]|nr:hypothetical protein [Maribacter antarcticus]
MNTSILLSHDDEQRAKFMSFYRSENRLVIEAQDTLFFNAFKTHNVKDIV